MGRADGSDNTTIPPIITPGSPAQNTTNTTNLSNQCTNETTLDNGASLSAKIIPFPSTFQTSDSIKINGNASIGQGADQGNDHWTYVIDTSTSTNRSCGIPGNSSVSVLDCEKQAILGLHAEIEASGLAVDYGLTAFDDAATISDFGGSPVTTDRGTQEGDIADEVNELTQCSAECGTNYADALSKAAVSVNASSAGNKHIVFLSDGEYSGNISAALMTLKTLGVKIFSFAIGSESNCTDALQQMANETGGFCKHVTSAANLGNELKNLGDELKSLVTSKMMNDSLTVDGSLVGATHTKVFPFDGPGEDQLSYTVPASSLAVGKHTACISAAGRGPADAPASEETVGCCMTFKVRA